jgi:hypothetical protein
MPANPLKIRVDSQKRRLHIVVLAMACSASFTIGWWFNNYRLKDRVYAEGLLRFQEFIVFADELGIINRERLDEVIAAGNAEDLSCK